MSGKQGLTPEQQHQLDELNALNKLYGDSERVELTESRLEIVEQKLDSIIEMLKSGPRVCDYCRGAGVTGHCKCPTRSR